MSSKNIIPNGPTIFSSGKFAEVSIGLNCSRTSLTIYGDTYSCGAVNSKIFKTNPGNLVMQNNMLTGLDFPSNPLDAASKEYVDSVAQGLSIKAPVNVSTFSNTTLFGLQTIDGYNINSGDRVLVKDQTNGINNGIYIASVGSWTRSTDLPLGSSATKTAVNVLNGTIGSGNIYVCTNIPPSDIVGIDALDFELFMTSLKPGIGLSRAGNYLNVNFDNSTIGIDLSNQLIVKDLGITTQKINNAAVTNSKLQFSSIGVNTGSGLTGGGVLSLGSSATISVDSTVVRTTGAQTISGPKSFSDKIILESGINGISLQAPFIVSSYTLTLPPNTGTSGQFLKTDGSGLTSWQTVSADVSGPNSSTNNAIALFDGTTGKLIKNSGVIVNGNNVSGINNLTATSITDGTAVLTLGTLTGITTVNTPTSAVNKQYVDDLLTGMTWKQPVILSSTGNLPLSGLGTIDGVNPGAGYRILVKNQLLPVQNGIYIASAGAWLRAEDFAVGDGSAGSVVWCETGLTNGQTGFVCTNVIGSDTIGVDPNSWLQFTGGGLILAGDGLTKLGNTLNVNVDNSTIEIVLNNLQVKALGITNSQIANNTISNTKLINSSISVLTGSGLTGGASISLGSSASLSVDSTVIRTTGAQSMSGPKTFTDGIVLETSPGISVLLRSSPSLLSSYTLTLPVNDGNSGQVLTTDGSGNTYWAAGGIGGGDVTGPASSTDTAIALYDGITGKIIKNSVVTVSGTGVISGVLTLNAGTTNTTTLNINSESISGQRLLYSYDSLGLTSITSSYQTLVFNVNSVNDAGYTNTLGEITLASGGTYEINYYTQFQTKNVSGGRNATVTSILEKNGVLVPGSGVSCYITEENGALIGPGSGKNVIITANPGDVLRVRFARTYGTTTGETKPGESSISIRRLRP